MSDSTTPLDKADIYASLRDYAEAIEHDPQTNSVFRLAQDYFFALSAKSISVQDLFEPIESLTSELFDARAKHIAQQHGIASGSDPWQSCRADLEGWAAQGIEKFTEELAADPGGIVFTGHPTFAHSKETYEALAERASGHDTAFPQHAQGRTGITLPEEHSQAQDAVQRAQTSVSKYLDLTYEVARQQFPDQWKAIDVRVPTLASWVGYDLDGRSDIAWWTTVGLRLSEKSAQLIRYADRLSELAEVNADIARLETALKTAADLSQKQADLFFGDLSKADLLVEAANSLTDTPSEFVSSAALADKLCTLANTTDDAVAQKLLVLKSEVETFGFGTARIHLRINAAQIQTVIKRDLGLMTEDHNLGQVALTTLADMIRSASPISVNFGDLFLEQSTARRQFMLCAQILKHIDADTPIRFLIAESENPATVLGALFLAKQYGVSESLDISPLFETPEALENGGRFMARLLKVSEFRDHVKSRGRLAIQLGFSDAGRFIGQVSADIAIERIVAQIAHALADRMPGTPLLVFNTHGESIGRGAYPGSFEQRLRHVLPKGLKSECTSLGIPIQHEVSFQGGDGYLHFATDKLSDSAFLAFSRDTYLPDSTPTGDPFYTETGLAWDFYTALRSWHETLFDEDDYGLLLGDFAGGFLLNAGSRPKRRQKGPAGPRSLRAISHNATLQQLGALANTACGIGSALKRDMDDLIDLINHSDRLRSLIDLAVFARVRTSIPALRGYASVYSPSYWVACSKHNDESKQNARTLIARLLRKGRTNQAIMSCADHFSIDLGLFDRLITRLDQSPSVETRHEARLPIHALHAIRQGAMMRALEIAGSLPSISARHGFNIDDVQQLILQMRISEAVDLLKTLFPKSAMEIEELKHLHEVREDRNDLTPSDYASLHEEFLDPLIDIQSLVHRVSRAIAHAHYAYG